ncbi:heavy-metal-associated domain-containing protein [Staphylococcus chromogenes]|uniref:heavy-metal-associated domain-containing protein n=1 Tax=Staphylococcus TaxID=1279 RepID=UPI000D02BEE1|nr:MULTISPECIES: heavy-metal-associated domain-containing protein [Staphylococcus]MCE4970378.1 heavy-metal-associated domain-containing protein [Staphylococcus chromogenes]NHM77331.1 heavy-metal-associated domain-containing protein [Staphylococcus sp. 11511212]
MKQITLQLETLTCPSCIASIEGLLNRTKGVYDSKVLFNTSKAKMSIDEEILTSEAVKNKIENLGYKVLKIK